MASYAHRQAGAPAGGGVPRNSILGALKAMDLSDSKPVLPAEILATILDYLPVPDLMHFAQTSRRFREMVYDDTRWVARLRSMGCWNEAEARRRFEEAVARRRRDTAAAAAAASGISGVAVGGGTGVRPGPARAGAGAGAGGKTLFDASLEEERRRQMQLQQQQLQQQQLQQQEQLHQQHVQLAQLRDGFEPSAVGGSQPPAASSSSSTALQDPQALVEVFKHVRSIRGYARQEYARIYGMLAPFYWDLVQARSHADPAVFKVFRDPERQAQMLAQLQRFQGSDWSQGWQQREERLAAMTGVFESAVLREFEQGYEFWDVDGRMRQYAHVLSLLNGSTAGVDLFIQKHPIFADREVAASNSMDCLRRTRASNTATAAWGVPAAAISEGDQAAAAADDIVTLEPSRAFFERLAAKVNEQGTVIGRIFPQPARVFWAFVDKVREDIIMKYITPLLDEAHERNMAAYLKAVSGLFEQCLQFFKTLEPPRGTETAPRPKKRVGPAALEKVKKEAAQDRGRPVSWVKGSVPMTGEEVEEDEEDDNDDEGWTPRSRQRKVKEMAYRAFEPHLDLYLQEELDFFTKHAEAQVGDWDKKLLEQDASVESFYMANFNRQEVKKDFLSSFRKVVMMPVTVLPGPLNPFGSGSSSSSSSNRDSKVVQAAPSSGRSTPVPGGLPSKAPDDELAAKAALMESRLAGIKSLFSIEVALNLVHAAKASLGRAAVFVQLDGQAAGEAREQCEAVFVVLLRVLGSGHVKQGFDRAVDHLSHYNPRAGRGSITGAAPSDGGVAPLMTFIELVNVGDLISQMIDVFYEQQLAGPKLADRNDFLDPAGIAKKRFEQMIDESVAAGLNKGIDVLMDEVEYICATMQKPTDYYPESADAVAETGLSFLNGTLASVTGTSASGSGSSTGGGGTSTPTPGGATAAATAPIDGNGAAAAGGSGLLDIGPTPTAEHVVELVRGHTNMLKGSTEKTMLDVFNGEVGLRLFTAVCKHLKRQRISMAGAVHVIADMTLYFDFVTTLRNPDLLAYFRALRELSQLYLIDARHHAKEMAVIIADGDRFGGVFRAEEVYEFAERRADWYQVKRDVERAMYGLECSLM